MNSNLWTKREAGAILKCVKIRAVNCAFLCDRVYFVR